MVLSNVDSNIYIGKKWDLGCNSTELAAKGVGKSAWRRETRLKVNKFCCTTFVQRWWIAKAWQLRKLIKTIYHNTHFTADGCQVEEFPYSSSLNSSDNIC